MSKKIIFVGPPGVGKTTLRKIFFEYQSADQLMQYALDPTYGAESIILNLEQQIGIFDLAGQELDRWVNNTDVEIFLDTTYIIAVIDAISSIDDIINFTKKIVNVRDKMCPRSTIFLLVHKIDLLSKENLESKKKGLYSRLKLVTRIKIEFTSVVRPFFLRTLKMFQGIIGATLDDEVPLETVDAATLKDLTVILRCFQKTNSYTIRELLDTTRIPEKKLVELLEILRKRQIIVQNDDEGSIPTFSLPDGIRSEKLPEIVMGQVEKHLLKNSVKNHHVNNESNSDVPPVLGFIIADINGRTLLVVESHNGILRHILGINDDSNFDLIPPFISALSSFSKEIRLVNTADFKIKGQNATLYVLEHDPFDLIMFLNPDVNTESLKPEIQDFFTRLVNKHSALFHDVLSTGDVACLSIVKNEAENKLFKINETYLLSANDDKFFDLSRAQQLYAKLDKIDPGKADKKSARHYEIHDLKRRLVTAIMEKNSCEIKQIDRAITSMLK